MPFRFGQDNEKKIKTFFSKDYPEFLLRIYQELNPNITIQHERMLQSVFFLKRKIEISYNDIESKFKLLDPISLKNFKTENNLHRFKLLTEEEKQLKNNILSVPNSAHISHLIERFNPLSTLIKGRIEEFLNNNRNRPHTLEIEQQPPPSTPAATEGGKRKTNKKKRVNNKKSMIKFKRNSNRKSKRNAQRKRKSKRVNRKM